MFGQGYAAALLHGESRLCVGVEGGREELEGHGGG